MCEKAARVLKIFVAKTYTFDPSGLPLPDDADILNVKVKELQQLVEWSEAMVWCSSERHGAMTGIMKTRINWIPLLISAVQPTQGKALAVMQVSVGLQNFNVVS